MAQLITLGAIIDQSIHRFREHFRELLHISLWMLAGYPFYVASLLVYFAAPESETAIIIASGLSVLGSFVMLLAGIVTYGALILGAPDVANGKSINANALLRASIKKISPQFWLWLFVAAVIVATALLPLPGYVLLDQASLPDAFQLLGLLLFFIGGIAGIILCVRYAVSLIMAPYTLLLEQTPLTKAPQRAIALVKKQWWAVAFRVLMPKVLVLIIMIFLQLIVLTFISVLIAAIVSQNTLVEGGLALSMAATVKDISSALIVAIGTPLFVLSDYYVFASLVSNKNTA